MQTNKIDFMAKRRVFFAISGCIIAVILLSCLVFGVKMDIQFKGGALVSLSYQGDVDMNGVESTIKSSLGSDVTVQSGSNSVTGQQSVTITMPGFRVRSAVSNRVDNTLLSDTLVQLELVVRSGKSGTVVWRSGVVSYFDRFETVDEASAIRDGLKEALRRALDRMQQKF